MKGDRTNRCIIRRLTDAGETAVAILFTTGDVNYRCRTTENQMDGLTFTSRCSRCVRQNPHVIARSKAKQKNPGRRDVHPSPSASLCYVITFVSYPFYLSLALFQTAYPHQQILNPIVGNFVPHTTYRGFAPGSHWGTSVPRPLTFDRSTKIYNLALAVESEFLCDRESDVI